MYIYEQNGMPTELKMYLKELNASKDAGWFPDTISHLYRSTGHLKAYLEQTDDGIEVLIGILFPYHHDNWVSVLKPWKFFLEAVIAENAERVAHMVEDDHEEDELKIIYAKAMLDHDRYLLSKVDEDLAALGGA